MCSFNLNIIMQKRCMPSPWRRFKTLRRIAVVAGNRLTKSARALVSCFNSDNVPGYTRGVQYNFNRRVVCHEAGCRLCVCVRLRSIDKRTIRFRTSLISKWSSETVCGQCSMLKISFWQSSSIKYNLREMRLMVTHWLLLPFWYSERKWTGPPSLCSRCFW